MLWVWLPGSALDRGQAEQPGRGSLGQAECVTGPKVARAGAGLCVWRFKKTSMWPGVPEPSDQPCKTLTADPSGATQQE